MIEPILLSATRLRTFAQERLLTNASSFFFEREGRLYLVTSRHVMFDEPSKHYPDRVDIELHTDRDNLACSGGFSIPLYRQGKSTWHQGEDKARGRSFGAELCLVCRHSYCTYRALAERRIGKLARHGGDRRRLSLRPCAAYRTPREPETRL